MSACVSVSTYVCECMCVLCCVRVPCVRVLILSSDLFSPLEMKIRTAPLDQGSAACLLSFGPYFGKKKEKSSKSVDTTPRLCSTVSGAIIPPPGGSTVSRVRSHDPTSGHVTRRDALSAPRDPSPPSGGEYPLCAPLQGTRGIFTRQWEGSANTSGPFSSCPNCQICDADLVTCHWLWEQIQGKYGDLG